MNVESKIRYSNSQGGSRLEARSQKMVWTLNTEYCLRGQLWRSSALAQPLDIHAHTYCCAAIRSSSLSYRNPYFVWEWEGTYLWYVGVRYSDVQSIFTPVQGLISSISLTVRGFITNWRMIGASGFVSQYVEINLSIPLDVSSLVYPDLFSITVLSRATRW